MFTGKLWRLIVRRDMKGQIIEVQIQNLYLEMRQNSGLGWQPTVTNHNSNSGNN
jgi:hypothetical protein